MVAESQASRAMPVSTCPDSGRPVVPYPCDVLLGMPQMIHLNRPRTGDETFSPDAAQRAVITHADGHLLVLAGPSTGKTSVIVEVGEAAIRSGQPAGSLLITSRTGRLAAQRHDNA